MRFGNLSGLVAGHRALLALTFGTAFALAGCRSKPVLTPQQAEGKRLYDVGCAHCHEENDLHLKTIPPSLHGLFNRETLPDGAPATDAGVRDVLLHGKGLMPSFAYQMTNEQLAALLAYLHAGVRPQSR